MTEEEVYTNYEIFREALSGVIIERSRIEDTKRTKQRRKRGKNHGKHAESALNQDRGAGDDKDAEELADFIEYLATELFSALSTELRTLTYSTFKSSSKIQEIYSAPLSHETCTSLTLSIPPNVTDSLISYSLIPEVACLPKFLSPVYDSYLTTLTTLPPAYNSAAQCTSACEICSRDWIPLTYHHLIPRAVHAKTLKRGWHEQWQLNAVAWLCRACHSFVHRIASNEELARHWWTVEKLTEREDVQRWARWVGRVRWKAA